MLVVINAFFTRRFRLFISAISATRMAYTILVTGSRAWTNRALVEEHLDGVARLAPAGAAIRLVHGGARGADQMAAAHARARGWHVKSYVADWVRYKRAAGVRRNAEMLADARPDVAVAFHRDKSRGTADMIRRVRATPGVMLVLVEE